MAITERYVTINSDAGAGEHWTWTNTTAYTTGQMVVGTNGYGYYCSTAHTAETGVKGAPITGTDWATYWTICDGTATYPWTLTQAIASVAAGDRVNIKSGAYPRTATDTVGTDGTVTQPIVWRGYHTTIGDLDAVGRTNGNGPLIGTNFPVIAYDATRYWNSVNGNYHVYQCVKITGAYDGWLFTIGLYSNAENCIVENASTHETAVAITVNASGCVINCDASTTGASGSAAAVACVANACAVYGCRITGKNAGIITSGNRSGQVYLNNVIFSCGGIGIDLSQITSVGTQSRVCGNTIYSCAGGGILGPNAAMTVPSSYIDNHITDCTGYAFDSAYKGTGEVCGLFAFNRTRDNSSGAIDGHDDWATAAFNHVTTDTGGAGTDYADAGAGDFNLIATAPGRGKACNPYRDIGAVQHADPAGGGGGGVPVFGGNVVRRV